MDNEVQVADLRFNEEVRRCRSICLHTFSNLSRVSPVVFVHLLKACYFAGTCKATVKFRALQQQVHTVLQNHPEPGPATFVIQCIHVLPLYGPYCDGFSHLILSALNRFLKLGSTLEDTSKAKQLAARIFVDAIGGSTLHEEKILLKILQIFDVKIVDIEKVMLYQIVGNGNSLDKAKQMVEEYIFKVMQSESYMTAASLLEHFCIRHLGESFLLEMIKRKHYKAAEKWATFMGKSFLCLLIQEYVSKNKTKFAVEIIKKNNLQHEFPDVYEKHKWSSLKKFAEKGCWDVAESWIKDDRQLLEYLVYLAMEAGYAEKVDELCIRYPLEGFVKSKEDGVSVAASQYLQLGDLNLEDCIWVDEVSGLQRAVSCIEDCKVIGVDCEWKPNYVKGSSPNKVSIMQIATDKAVYVLDLIKLFQDKPEILNVCLERVFHSPQILKLGYNFQCDIHQLSRSYNELPCFRHYEMLLDIQSFFKEHRGGLSGLTKNIMGVPLKKTRRNSNWEQRPLSKQQLEYAALDAAVLVQIFYHLRAHPEVFNGSGKENVVWKSHIVSHIDTQITPRKPMKKDA